MFLSRAFLAAVVAVVAAVSAPAASSSAAAGSGVSAGGSRGAAAATPVTGARHHRTDRSHLAAARLGPAAGTASGPSASVPAGSVPVPADLAAGGLLPLPATRILDTRTGLGGTTGKVAPRRTVVLQVAGQGHVPSGTRTVALTVTAVAPTATGWLMVHAAGSPVPTASALNYAAGQNVPNLVVAQLDAAGRVALTVGGSGSVHVLADVAGFVRPGTATEAATVTSVAPSRLLDSRTGIGTPARALGSGATVHLPVAGRGGVPSDGSAGSVLLNVTATNATAGGYLSVVPAASGTPTTSSLNFVAGQSRANLVAVPLSDTGTVDLVVNTAGTVHVLGDVVGWVRAGDPAVVGALSAVSPRRIVDTRSDPEGPLADGEAVTVGAAGFAGVPASGVSAILANVTATRVTGAGYVSALPTGPNLPQGSNLNFTPGRNDANLVLVPVNSRGEFDLVTTLGSGRVDLIVDVAGYVLGPPADTTPPAAVTGLTIAKPTRNSFTLSWTKPADADFAGVLVTRVVDGTASVGDELGTVVARTTGTTFTDANLTPGTSYGYSVVPYDDVWNVGTSAVANGTTTALTWSAPKSIAPFRGVPTDVSCPTTTWCMAVDRSGQALTFNGSTWGSPKAILGSHLPDAYGRSFDISCPTTTFCIVPIDDRYAVYRAGSWSVATFPSGGPVTAIDCVSPTFCVAVSRSGYSRTFNGLSWTQPVKRAADLRDIDCVSATWCMAVGGPRGQGITARMSGTTWSVTTEISPGDEWTDVSCASTRLCVLNALMRARTWDGSRWLGLILSHTPSSVSCSATGRCLLVSTYEWSSWDGVHFSSGPLSLDSRESMAAVSCAVSTCVIVDGAGRFVRSTGGAWTPPRTFDPTYGGLVDVSCAGTTCMATDMYGSAFNWNGSAWSRAQLGVQMREVECGSPTWCMSMDAVASSARIWSNDTWGTAVKAPEFIRDYSCPAENWCMAVSSSSYATWTGAAWSSLRKLPTGSPGAPWLDCTSGTFCMMTDGGGSSWSTWNGSTWSSPRKAPGVSDGLGVVNCAAPTSCVSMSRDESHRWDGSGWHTTAGFRYLYAVDCPTASACLGVMDGYDGTFLAFTHNGQTWNRDWDVLPGLSAAYTPGVSCISAYTCMVVGEDRVVTSS